MATLVFSAIGTLIGGPLGGAIGALAGQAVDRVVIGSPSREGPRLKELAITTSSYGAGIPRIYGKVRVPGSIIWATDLVEDREKSGGGKGSPSVTTYSYSVSFAVALASRPIRALGRIWADGSLLRGAGCDLKVGGQMRFYDGHGDQQPDPLILSAQTNTPAYRHTAYVVFEDLQLAEFGNRIPALTFEVFADDGEVTLAQLVEASPEPLHADRALSGLQGFTYEGGRLADVLASVHTIYPLTADAGPTELTLRAGDAVPDNAPLLPEAVAADDGESFGAQSGMARQREAGAGVIPDTLRYYDIERDYQAGLQRTDGRAQPGQGNAIEFPGSFAANDARALINAASERAGWARETIAWRTAELDPAIVPGAVVRVPDHPGHWRVDGWEWRERGVELELRRLPRGPARQPPAEPGSIPQQPDIPLAPTVLHVFEMPWDGVGSSTTTQVFAAASATSAGWKGAALYAQHGGTLTPLGSSGARRNIVGSLVSGAPSSTCHLIDRASITVDLLAADFALTSTTVSGLANGANRALIGNEVVQFLQAEALGDRRWRLSGLLRGRGGSEAAALAGHQAGASFILLDGAATPLDPNAFGTADEFFALGLGDSEPVAAPLTNRGVSLRPLAPVHPRTRVLSDGSLQLGWTRRARGAWNWPDGVDTPLHEESEAYLVGIGNPDAPALHWNVSSPQLTLPSATVTALHADHSNEPLWVRQVGRFALSPTLLLTILA